MSIFASLLQMNHSMAQTKMPPYNPYQDTWNEDSVTDETHIDAESDGAAWINNAKDRTHSIIANLEISEEPAQLSEFYDPETFTSRFGQDVPPAANTTHPSRPSLHRTPTITSDLPALSHVCSCCQLPLAPSDAPPSPLMHTAKDLCCACYCPDIKMPKEMMDPAPSQKPHIRRKSSLAMEENQSVGWHRVHTPGGAGCAERESVARNEMSIGAWL